MARKRYEIDLRFTYGDGTEGGRLHTIVNSKKAVTVQLAADRQWLRAKGHTETSLVIREQEG